MIKSLKTQLLLSVLASLAFLLGSVYLITRGFIYPAVVLISLVCIYLVVLLLWFLRRVEQPILSMTDVASRIASGSFGVQAEKLRDDEIGALTESINKMSEKVAVADKNKTEFISQISHELRTPLTAIQGWAETIAFDEAVTGDSLRGINIISKEAERLTGMVSEMLEFARIQDGRFNLRCELIDITAELEDALFTYGELIRQAGIEVEFTQPDTDIPLISADPERLKQVFLNLLDNAAKHGGDGNRIDVGLKEDKQGIIISFRDYGHGIPEAELPHVKEKFYKGSSKNRGTGIGLAVCDEIISRHGGTLTIANVGDETGCIATVVLPRQSGENHAG